MQKWEYLTINRRRGWRRTGENANYSEAAEWVNWVSGVPDARNFYEILEDLGEQGWELVAISDRSGMMGTYVECNNELFSGTGTITIPALDFAGFTNNEAWVFKRPKEGGT
jgi:hypothetical protein